MAMDDEETVALIAGGHTFGKVHGRRPKQYVGPEPEGHRSTAGTGLENTFGAETATRRSPAGSKGLTATPATWDNSYFDNLFNTNGS